MFPLWPKNAPNLARFNMHCRFCVLNLVPYLRFAKKLNIEGFDHIKLPLN